MAASREYHPEWDNPVTKEQTQYAVTDNWILTPEAQTAPETTLRLYEVQRKTKTKINKKKNHYA